MKKILFKCFNIFLNDFTLKVSCEYFQNLKRINRKEMTPPTPKKINNNNMVQQMYNGTTITCTHLE